MKDAATYKNWNGPVTIDELHSKDLGLDDLIWHASKCTCKKEHPTDCTCREPIIAAELNRLNPPVDGLYYHRKRNSLCWLGFSISNTITLALTLSITLVLTGQCEQRIVENSEYQAPTEVPGPEPNPGCDCDTTSIPGRSKSGKEALFLATFLTQEKRWELESETELLGGSLSEILGNHLPHFPALDKSIGLIAVGVASEEAKSQKTEEERASIRADNILFEIKQCETCKGKEYYTLNLGKHKVVEGGQGESNGYITSYQRRVIVISILKKEEDMSTPELEEALINALEDSKRLDFDLNSYSKFDLNMN